MDPDKIRAAGLSRPKISYLRDLAEHVEKGELQLELLDELPDEEVIEQLTAVKGIGEWSAHMFLMFHLGRPDILPVGDQGIRRAVQVQYGLRKIPDPKRLEKIARPWRPYRTLACLYLWSSLDNKPGRSGDECASAGHTAVSRGQPAEVAVRLRSRPSGGRARWLRPRRRSSALLPQRGRRSRSHRRRLRSDSRPRSRSP